MEIAFVDLKKQYQSLKSEIDSAIQSVIDHTAFIGGNNHYIQIFEESFASYIGSRYCISCANGTDSIEIILKAAGIGINDEVIVPANSWISTSEAVSNIGAKPIFVDCLQGVYTMDPKDLTKKITSLTKAIIPVHLYGLPAEMDEIMNIANKYKLFVLEDCAQAHGAVYKGRKTGSIGHAASFSFYPGKNLGAYGDAGAIITDSEELAKVCKMIANHGQVKKHNHLIEGRNSRLDGIQAAVLNVKLPFLDQWNNARKRNAEAYRSLLNGIVITPYVPINMEHVFHLFVIQVGDRENKINELKKKGIETAVHYPTPLPFLPAYKHYNAKPEDFPVAYGNMSRILSLPMFAELKTEEIEYITEVFNVRVTH